MKERKRIIVIGVVMVLVLLVLSAITNYVDTGRVTTNHEPKYCIKVINKEGNKITYWGLGYKVVRYVGVSPSEPYESNIGVKMGSWLMKYELPIDSEPRKDENIQINQLNDFYNIELTKGNDIRSLQKEYTLFDAEKDNCFVVGAETQNNDLYHAFMENCKNQKTAFIRVAQNTVEGDLILYDILYYEKTKLFYLVTDDTRDKFLTDSDRKIELKQFQNISEYEYENHLYWVLHNEEITDENFKSDNVFVIAMMHELDNLLQNKE